MNKMDEYTGDNFARVVAHLMFMDNWEHDWYWIALRVVRANGYERLYDFIDILEV
jgi:hypothetical protein